MFSEIEMWKSLSLSLSLSTVVCMRVDQLLVGLSKAQHLLVFSPADEIVMCLLFWSCVDTEVSYAD